MEIIEVLSLCIGSIILSFGMELSNEFKMLKDAADLGYKINNKKVIEFSKRINPELVKYKILLLFFPIVNIMTVALNRVKYIHSVDSYFTQLDAIGALEEMSNYEKTKYKEKPTGLNAFMLPIKMELKLKTATKMEFPDNSVVYFDKNDDEIVIYKAEGPISKLSEEEQTQKIIETYYKVLKDLYSSYENIEDLMDDLLSGNNSIEIKKSKSNEKINNETEVKINNLRQLKEELLQEKEENENKPLVKGRRK